MSLQVDASLLRLLQLCSSTLPIGGFTYSQGIEWAVECGWIHDEASLKNWLAELIETSLARVEIPVLVRLYTACEERNRADLSYWSRWLLASRETRELREEESNRGRALARLLEDLQVQQATNWHEDLKICQSAGFAAACHAWSIPLHQAAQGFAWTWLENLALAGVKLVPLGQTAGQRLLGDMSELVSHAVERGLSLPDHEMGGACMAMAVASSRHETQYTRLFRS